MKKFFASLSILLSTAQALGAGGLSASYVRLEPSSLPALCRQGDLRVDIITGKLELCDNANTWGGFGTVSGGGTGLATATAHSVIVGNGTSPFTQVGPGASGTVFTGAGASANPAFSPTPSLGVAGSTLGTLAMSGNTSGTVTIQPQAIAGTYNFNLPTGAGTSGQPLLSAGGGTSPMTFGTLSAAFGGTGQISHTAHSVLLGEGSSAFSNTGAGSTGSVLAGNGSSDPFFTTTPTLGITGSSLGSLGLLGNTSGTVSIKPQAAAGTYNFNLPTTAGTSGQPLLSGGGVSSPMTFGSLGAANGGTGTDLSGSTGAVSVSSGTFSAGTLSVANGGTGQTSASAAFNALSPATAKGGLVVGSGANAYANLAVGTNSFVLTADSAQTSGVKWAASGGALSGSKNYLSAYTASTSSATANTGNGNFELNATTGWTLAHSSLTSAFPSTVATATNSFSAAGGAHGGSAANGNLTGSIVSSSTLAGSYSYSYASSAATTAGDMLISDAFWLDAEDQAKVMTIKFNYQGVTSPSNDNWSGTSSNSFGVAVYDVTAAAWIMPAGVWCMTQSSGVGYCTGTFQTTAASTQYQLAIFNANASSGATTLYFDDMFLGPQTAPFGPAMTDMVAFTPTGSWSTNTTYTGWWKREGDKLSMIVKLALAGAPTSTSLQVNLPSGLVIDTAKLPATPGNTLFGQVYGQGAAHTFTGAAIYSSTTTLSLTYTLDGNTASIMTLTGITQALPYTFANTDFIYAVIDNIPISGWSSNTAMSNDTDTRVLMARYYKSSSVSTTNQINFDTLVNDTHAAVTTGSSWAFTAPVTGYYQVDCFVGTTTTNTYIIINKNGSAYANLTYSGAAALGMGSAKIQLNAGDTMDLRPSATVTIIGNASQSNSGASWISISRLSGPAVIAASEKVYLQYTGNGGTSITNGVTNIDWITKVVDSHNAWNGTTFTCPRSGWYILQGEVNHNVITSDFSLYKNGSQLLVIGTPASAANHTINASVFLNAGDTLTVRGNTITLSNSATVHWISIFSQG